MQSDINNLQAWSKKWLLTFHPAKCKSMRIGTKTPPAHSYIFSTEHGPVALEWSQCEKDLGVLVDSELSFNQEISTRVCKANKIVGIIRRSFLHLNEKSFKTLYKCLVQPHLEYAAAVWMPHKLHHIDEIEKVQRRASKLIPSLKHLSYSDRLKKLSMTSQRFRHLRGDMIHVFKILNSLHDIEPSQFFSQPTVSSTRGHQKKLHKPSVKSTRKLHSFSYRTIATWNNLPDSVISAPTINAFKNRLDRHWARHPLMHAHRE